MSRYALSFVLAFCVLGCKSSGGGDGQTSLLDNVGKYPPAPTVVAKPTLAMTTLKLEDEPGSASMSNASLAESVTDTFGDLLAKSGRFTVVPRAEFARSIDRQQLSDVVQPGRVVRVGQAKGVDLVLTGSITSVSIAKRAEDPGMFERAKNFVTRAADNKTVVVTATCGVGYTIIDPSTGDVVLQNNSEFTRTAPAGELGLDVMRQAGTTQPADLNVTREDREMVIKLALDDSVRKSLAKIDRVLSSRQAQGTPAVVQQRDAVPSATPRSATSTPAVSSPAPAPSTASSSVEPRRETSQLFCPVCGTENAADAKICKRCGANLKS